MTLSPAARAAWNARIAAHRAEQKRHAEAMIEARRPRWPGNTEMIRIRMVPDACEHDWQANVPCHLVDTCSKCGEVRA